MSKLLTGIYADSTPGGGVKLTEKCGNLRSSTGVSALTVYASPEAPLSSDLLGDRAQTEPGTHPTLNRGNTLSARQARNVGLGFTVLGTTYFNGSTMMYGLPHRSTDSGNISLSFWISPGPDGGSGGPAQGCILMSPLCVRYIPANDPGPATVDETYLYIGALCGDGTVTATGATSTEQFHVQGEQFGQVDPGPTAPGVVDTVSYEISDPAGGGSYALNYSPAQNAGLEGKFFHVMYSQHTVGGVVKCTLYVNDDAIFSDATLVDPGFFHTDTPIEYSKLVDNANTLDYRGNEESDGLFRNWWNIGGAMNARLNGAIGPTPSDDGLNCAVTELWIAEGTYVDWSNPVMRNKFHTTDDITLDPVYVPVNLGTRGQRPTGTAPTMYYTGKPTNFKVNRVTGATASVYGSLTLDTRAPGA